MTDSHVVSYNYKLVQNSQPPDSAAAMSLIYHVVNTANVVKLSFPATAVIMIVSTL